MNFTNLASISLVLIFMFGGCKSCGKEEVRPQSTFPDLSIRTFTGHSSWVLALAISPDGKYIVSGSGDGTAWQNMVPPGNDCTIRIWKLSSGKQIRVLKGHTSSVCSVAVTSDGKRIISSSEDETIRIWDFGSGNELRTLTGHNSPVRCVTVSPDNEFIISGDDNGKVKIWQLSTGQEIHSFDIHRRRVNSVAVIRDGMWLISGSDDYTVKVWEMSSGEELLSLSESDNGIESLSVIPDSAKIVAGTSGSGEVIAWDIVSSSIDFRAKPYGDMRYYVNSVLITPNRKFVIAAYESDNQSDPFGRPDLHTIKVWERSPWREVRTLTGHTGGVKSLAITPDGKYIVSGSMDKTIKVWELK